MFLKGSVSILNFNFSFPAELLDTEKEWEDLVLDNSTHEQLREIEIWSKHQEILMNDWGCPKKN
ncbi:MAG: hypothetical protein AB8H03_08080 [Saprospiraceae bacterium]